MQDAQTIRAIRREYGALRVEMDEPGRRQWAAVEARELGWGGVKVTDEEVARLKLAPHSFHGEWNYTLSPRRET